MGTTPLPSISSLNSVEHGTGSSMILEFGRILSFASHFVGEMDSADRRDKRQK